MATTPTPEPDVPVPETSGGEVAVESSSLPAIDSSKWRASGALGALAPQEISSNLAQSNVIPKGVKR